MILILKEIKLSMDIAYKKRKHAQDLEEARDKAKLESLYGGGSGLDTSLEQESLLDSWVLWGCQWKFKELFAYAQLPELKELNKHLQKEVGYLKLLLIVFKLIPLKLKIRRRTKAMDKKWPFKSPDSLMTQRVCNLRKEYGIKILEPEERVIADPLIWEGTISN